MPEETTREKKTWQNFSAGEYYQKFCVPKKFEPWPPVLLDRVRLSETDRVLDCACGTGVVTRQVAQRLGPQGRVVGLDFNEGMLSVAQSVPNDGAKIEWVKASVDNIPFPDDSFDVVTCELGLMYFPDRVAALREMRRVLAPNGRAGILVWRNLDHCVSFKILADVVEKHLHTDADPIRWPYNMGNAETLHDLMDQAGFQNVVTHAETGPMLYSSVSEFFHEYLWGSPISAAIRESSEEAQAAAVEDLQRGLAPYVKNGKLDLSIGAYIVVARK